MKTKLSLVIVAKVRLIRALNVDEVVNWLTFSNRNRSKCGSNV